MQEIEKPEIKKEIAKQEVDKKSDEKLVKQAEDKAWADIDTPVKVDWMKLRELLPRLIVENEKIIAAEQDYEAAKRNIEIRIHSISSAGNNIDRKQLGG